jgi:hypothetical protein
MFHILLVDVVTKMGLVLRGRFMHSSPLDGGIYQHHIARRDCRSISLGMATFKI